MTDVAVMMPERTTKLTFKTDLNRFADEINKVAHKGFTAERIFAGALAAAVKNPEIFDCDPGSLFLGLHKAARLGLDIGESGLYLVPMRQTIKAKDGTERKVLMAECWADYRGLKLLAYRAKIVRHMDEYVVYQGDRFEYELGLDPRLIHQPTGDKAKRGKIVGAYSIIERYGAPRTFHWMPIEEIEQRRQKSRSWGPKQITECPPWYAKKSVVRDYLSRQPKTGEMVEALASDDTEDSEPVDVSADAKLIVDRDTGEIFGGPATEPGDAREDDGA